MEIPQFRFLEVNDIAAIMEIEHRLFSLPWKSADYHYEITQNKYATCLAMIYNHKIIGYGSIWCVYEQAQITTIGIDKEFQGKGYGIMLCQALIDQAVQQRCNDILLEVRVSNVIAQNMYSNLGFTIISTRKGYYSDNQEDAYVMRKELHQ